ncbi:MAG: hypothetical protein ACPLY7_01725, partial [Microgenomates group bacterium]
MLKKFLKVIAFFFIIMAAVVGGDLFERAFGYRLADKILPPKIKPGQTIIQNKILTEESVVTEVVDKYGPSVVTVGIKKTEKVFNPFEDFFDPFGFFNIPKQTPQEQKIEQDIGSGFVVSKDGLIVTNKHVVSDTSAQYRVFTKDNKLY